MPKHNSKLISFLQDNPLFKDLSEQQIMLLLDYTREINVDTDEIIIRENEISDDLYIIKEGEVEVTKYDDINAKSHRLALLTKGAIIGEIALLDNAPRSATIKATKPTQLISISIASLLAQNSHQVTHDKLAKSLVAIADELHNSVESPTYHVVLKNIARHLGQRLRTTNDAVIEGLRKELELSKVRVAMGRFIVYTLGLMSFYIFILKTLEILHPSMADSALISIPLIAIFATTTFFMMKQSRYPFSLYGLTLKNWQHSVIESLLFTIPLLLAVLLYKWLLITYDPSFSHRALLDILHPHKILPIYFIIALVAIYLIFVPLQEFIVRGVMQSSLQELLTGNHKTAQAIILSNLLFGSAHLHVSLSFGFAVAIPGLFWGWLYARQRTLIGVTISHLLVGAWTFFIVGVKA